ncbi:MAG: hypothetical protein WDM89_04990 [Rhizomicrobium sp.]
MTDEAASINPMEQLLAFLGHLDEQNIGYILESTRDAIMVIVRIPSAVYEIEFFANGDIDIETIGPTQGVERVTLQDLVSAPEFKA